MREMNILQKEDLPYFEELEKVGKAVILRFDSLDSLMNYDFGALFQEDAREPDLRKIEEWIGRQKEIILQKGEEAKQKEDQITSQEQELMLLRKLQKCSLPVEDRALIAKAIEIRMPFEEILELLKSELDYEQRARKIQGFQER